MVRAAGKNGRTRRSGGRSGRERNISSETPVVNAEQTAAAASPEAEASAPVPEMFPAAAEELALRESDPAAEESEAPEQEGNVYEDGQNGESEKKPEISVGELFAAEPAEKTSDTVVAPESAAEEYVPGELDLLRGELFSEDLEQNAVEQMFQWAKEQVPSAQEEKEKPGELSGAALLEAVHHGRHVAVLALSLFEALSGRLDLDMRWARLLAQAALWHDLGFAVGGRRRHHKRSMEIIEGNGYLSLSFGLQESDRALVALLARYHRRAWPAVKHRRFAALCREDRRALAGAASLLRMADALDYRHRGAVEEVRVSLRRHAVRMVCFGGESCGRECRRALKKGDLFEELYGGRLEVVPGKEGDRDAR